MKNYLKLEELKPKTIIKWINTDENGNLHFTGLDTVQDKFTRIREILKDAGGECDKLENLSHNINQKIIETHQISLITPNENEVSDAFNNANNSRSSILNPSSEQHRNNQTPNHRKKLSQRFDAANLPFSSKMSK